LLDEWLARGVILLLLSPHNVAARHGGTDIRLGESVFHPLSTVLTGDYDVDRLDYMQRDGKMSGAGFGQVDLERFLYSMMLVKTTGAFEILPSSKALSTIESAVLERYKEYKWLVFHHKVLFFNQLTVELARDIFRDPTVRSSLFSQWSTDVPAAREYLSQMLQGLSSPSANIPPLNLYDGAKLGLDPGAWVLHGAFFVSNDDTYLMDDVWFCTRARALCNESPQGKLYREALVDRTTCGITVWKDLAEFECFDNECSKVANDCTDLADLANEDRKDQFPSKVGRWLKQIWDYMRHDRFGERACQIVQQYIEHELSGCGQQGIRTMFIPVNWRKLFGKLDSKRILGRRGDPVPLLSNSRLLKKLSGLEGEIPFYACLVGETEQLVKLKADLSQEKLLQLVARGFIIGLASCWRDPGAEEVRGAWYTVTEAE
jgi:hypothetical protein